MFHYFFLHIKIVSVMVLCSDHKRDAARAEDALTLSYGSELIGMQRDWNEELQSCREFPHGTPQERYTRCLINLLFSTAECYLTAFIVNE